MPTFDNNTLKHEVIDPHIHLFDVKGTPRPTQMLARMFGWNERLLRAAGKRMFPKATLDYFGEQNHLIVDYLTPEFRADSCGSGVARYVHIEAGWKDKKPLDSVGETEWLATLEDGPAAIVAHADMTLGAEVAEVFAAHLAASEKVRGIRHSLSNHAALGVMDFAAGHAMSRTSAFRSAFDQLAEHDLSFDAWCYHDQLDQVAELAEANPQVPMVLCHVGTPVAFGGPFCGVGGTAAERQRIRNEWHDGLLALADHEYVHCKISGLLMPALGFAWENAATKPTTAQLVDQLAPLVRPAIDAFGPDRCMVASNFPVDRVSASYANVFDAMMQLTETDGPEAQAAMFGGTAATFYRL